MKTLSPHSRCRVMMPAVMLLYAGSAFAGKPLTDSLKVEIRKASAAMYTAGNMHYLEADAVSDHLLKPGKHYRLAYLDSVLTINHKPLPAALRQQYQDKLLAFLHTNQYRSFSVESDGLKLTDILDEHSALRTYHAYTNTKENKELTVENRKNEDIDTLVAMLCRDKLIDPLAGYHVKLSPEGLFTNGQKLDDLRTRHYLKLLAETDPAFIKDNTYYLEITFKLDDDKTSK